jgi:hypothetical protein
LATVLLVLALAGLIGDIASVGWLAKIDTIMSAAAAPNDSGERSEILIIGVALFGFVKSRKQCSAPALSTRWLRSLDVFAERCS